jgi:hypothetical protein
MDDTLRLKLNQMINENDVTDQTELIRELKHSVIIKQNVNKLLELMTEFKDASYEELRNITIGECYFLFSYYTDIYNRIIKKEISIPILFKFLGVLETIENGKLGQHEGSFLVGNILKELYIDSALKKAELLDKQNEPIKQEPKLDPIKMSWKQYKSTTNISYKV